MKPSRRKRYRILTAAAELVSLWHRQEDWRAIAAAAAQTKGIERPWDRQDSALWNACWKLGDEFQVDWEEYYRQQEGKPSRIEWLFERATEQHQTAEELEAILNGTLEPPVVEMPDFPDPAPQISIRERDVGAASLPEIGRLFHCLLIKEKFCEGGWDCFIANGHLEKAIMRMEHLLQNRPDLTDDLVLPAKS